MTMISTGLSTLGGAVLSATTATIDSLDMTSGANDIVVVRHDDNALQSSPFNVRFGKAKVIRRSDKYVYVEVNGKRVKGVVLKLGGSGEAFWVQPASKEAPPEARCSPITSPRSSPGMSADGSPEDAGKAVPPPNDLEGDEDGGLLGRGVATDAVDEVARAKRASSASGSAFDYAGSYNVSFPVGSMVNKSMDSVGQTMGTPLAVPDERHHSLQVSLEGSMAATCLEADTDHPAMAPMLGDDEADKLLMRESRVLREMSTRLHPDLDGSHDMNSPLERLHTCHEADFKAEREATQSQAIPVGKPGYGAEEEGGTLRLARSAEKEDESYLAKRMKEEEQAALLASQRDADDAGLLVDVKLPVWKKRTDKDGKTYYWNMRTSECSYDKPEDPEDIADSDDDEDMSGGDAPNLSDDEDDRDEYENDNFSCVKTLYPSNEQLAQLGLQDGENEITFVVYTTLRGKQTVSCYAYLWDSNSQLVVSDVDGTITRSDVLGHILPKVGKDWTHKGICSLYNRIHDNGYKLIYLSSRSISQIASTRAFIEGVCQDDKRLPRAPILVAPDRIFAAFTREVVQRTPHEFKCRMLHTVRMAFPESVKDPFYAGFGNRINDAWAYAAVGIKQHKIFLIDPASEIHVFDQRVRMNTYGSLDQLADQAFPPLRPKAKVVASEFNAFNFWCLSPGLGLEDDADPNDLDTSGAQPVKYHVDPAAASMQSIADTGRLPSESAPSPPQRPPGLAAAWGSPISTPQPPVQMIEKALLSSPFRSPPRSPSAQPAESPKRPRSPNSPGLVEAAVAPVPPPTASPPAAASAGGGGGGAPQQAAGGSWGITSYFFGRRSPPVPAPEDEKEAVVDKDADVRPQSPADADAGAAGAEAADRIDEDAAEGGE